MALDRNELRKTIDNASSSAEVEKLRVSFLGRKGIITEQLKVIGSLPIDQRAAAGKSANELRNLIEDALQKKDIDLRNHELNTKLAQPLDITAPGFAPLIGHRHPVSVMLDELVELFWQMGYQIADGPEVETEWYNFEALLVGKDHPARDMQDTFYLEGGNLPRTHTSGIQIRYMEEHKDQLPIRILAPGKVYRNEDEDARHSWMFYQIEGLVVDKGISISDLKGTLEAMLRGILGKGTELRLRPNYFPYTEPSVEMDATCVICHGTGVLNGESCRLCTGTGWLELGGAGMVHPDVLKNAGIDPSVYSGFAFGFGPERIAAIKYGVGDVREFWRPSFKFLEQF
jgi:phenylalanyl-tRNA synthetase alpha chain